MEEKLFLKLRERYSEYGLGDELLKDYSKSICSFINLQEDVMDAFVERQSDALKSIQKTIDRRVTEALKKVTKVSASELELKTQLAASVFATLAEHKGTGVLEYLTKWTIETTNDIFKGIGTVEYKTDKEIEYMLNLVLSDMHKQIYSKDNQKVTYIVARFGRWMSTDHVGEIKDKIYILPMLAFYFNHSEVGIRFGFLNFEFHLWHKNYQKYDDYILKLSEK